MPEPGDGFFRLAETDQKFALHWKSGSLKYTNFKPMTEGGTAKLYRCFDENLRRAVVYKTLHDHLRDDEIETQRFLREARVTASIPHTGTVPVYELGRDRNGSLFFTMKHVRGRDLRNIIEALKSGGTLVYCEHGAAPDASVRRWQRRLEPVWGRLAGGCHLSRDIPRLLEQGGFVLDNSHEGYIDGWRPTCFNYWGTASAG